MLRSLSGTFRTLLLRQAPTGLRTEIWRQAWRRNITTSSPAQTIQWRAMTGFSPSSRVLRARFGTGRASWRTAARKKLGSRAQQRAFSWSLPWKSQTGGVKGTEQPQSLSARLRMLSREYGWAAVGVYLGLSILDFPFCFLLVRVVGTDRISEVEHWIMSGVKKLVPQGAKDWWHEYRASAKQAEKEHMGDNTISEGVEKAGWGVEEAETRHKEEASLATQLALAYAIHKSFIFVRVPLTAAVLPKVVRILRSWGWKIGKRRPKA